MKIEDFVPIDDLTEEGYKLFIERRGGCRCFISAPCNACVDPPTQEELEYFDIEVDEE